MTRKRFIKLLMGKFLLTRNEANYIADIVRICKRLSVVKNGNEECGYNGCGYDGFCNYGEQREPK